jgi:hypothetical protein
MTLRTITEAGMPVEKTSNHLQVKAKTIASWTESCKNLLAKVVACMIMGEAALTKSAKV